MNENLKEAVNARLPLIAVACQDRPFLADVVSGALEGAKRIQTRPSRAKPDWVVQGGVMWVTSEQGSPKNWGDVWKLLHASDASLVLVDWPDVPDVARDVGIVKAEEPVLHELLHRHAGVEADERLLRGLAGSTVVGALELHRLCMENHGGFDYRTCSVERAKWSDTDLLETVSTQYPYYQPDPRLAEWCDTEAKLFHLDAPQEIKPRGVLLSGTPGTGKTMAAKFLARRLAVPLKMLPISKVLHKYVGESERNFDLALNEAESCAPCVLLMDEVEKIFRMTGTGASDMGTTRRIMSRLLWWLQEHTSDVLTVMTTNDDEAIPPELIRPGRIDRWFDFAPYTVTEAELFIEAICAEKGIDPFPVPMHDVLTPASLTGDLRGRLKQMYLAGEWEQAA